jgi:hypothetical protein
MRRDARLVLGLTLLLLSACGKHKVPSSAVGASPLYTGKEPKRAIVLTLPAKDKAGFVQVKREIYQTASMVNQGKQVLQALMAGPAPAESSAASCFGANAAFSELYLDGKGLAVVDLPSATVAGLPGGTSAEVATLYCLLRTLSADVPGVLRVQILIDGAPAESLRGHVDTLDPLSLSDF